MTTSKPYKHIKKIRDFLFEAWYQNLNYAQAQSYFHDTYRSQVRQPNFPPRGDKTGACSSIRCGNFFGRNLDWYYSNLAEFVIHTPHEHGRFASIAMGGNSPGLTNDFVESGADSEKYRYLPFNVVDGINEHGLCVSVNVVPTTGKGHTTGTHSGKPELCGLMIPRYILDHHSSALAAVKDIADNFDVYMPYSSALTQEFHYLVADEDETYILEFIQNKAVYSRAERPYITNFHMDGVTFMSDGSLRWQSVEQYGQGLERYEIIARDLSEAATLSGMLSLLQRLTFTKAYIPSTEPYWYTEFTSEERGLKVRSLPSAFAEYVALAQNAYATRNRENPITWQTTHRSIYDIRARKLYLYAQEDDSIVFTRSLPPTPKESFNWDAVTFFRNLTAHNRLAQSLGVTFCRVSGLEGFEEALQSMQSSTAFVAVSDIAQGYTEMNNTPHTRRVKTVFLAMRHAVDDMVARQECMDAMRELFRQFMSVLIQEKVRAEEEHIYLDPRISFQEIDRYFFSGGACAYFQIATDVYTDLRYNREEWV